VFSLSVRYQSVRNTRDDATEVLEAAEHALDGIAGAIEQRREAVLPNAVCLGWDVGQCAVGLHAWPERVGIVALAGVQNARGGLWVRTLEEHGRRQIKNLCEVRAGVGQFLHSTRDDALLSRVLALKLAEDDPGLTKRLSSRVNGREAFSKSAAGPLVPSIVIASASGYPNYYYGLRDSTVLWNGTFP
jgi:hypothetical protein